MMRSPLPFIQHSSFRIHHFQYALPHGRAPASNLPLVSIRRKPLNELRQLARQRRCEAKPVTRARVVKAEPLGVQELATERGDSRTRARVCHRLISAAAVSLVADDGVLHPREVYANLMSAPSLYLNVEQREAMEAT